MKTLSQDLLAALKHIGSLKIPNVEGTSQELKVSGLKGRNPKLQYSLEKERVLL